MFAPIQNGGRMKGLSGGIPAEITVYCNEPLTFGYRIEGPPTPVADAGSSKAIYC